MDTENAMTTILPDTYTLLWNSSPENIFDKLSEESNRFWTEERKEKAQV